MKLSNYKLFLDDERMPGKALEDAVIVRDFWEFKAALKELGIPKYVTFDHDLGGRRSEFNNGKKCAEYLGYKILSQTPEDIADFRFDVHSQNPVGAENIRCFMEQLLREVQRGT